jgi:hypothetical protein
MSINELSGLGPPPDPAYIRFLDGLKAAAASAPPVLSCWHGQDEKWYLYAWREWALVDVYVAPTPPGLALMQEYGAFPKTSWRVNEFSVPDLFSRVQQAWRALHPRFSAMPLVWTFPKGEWRQPLKRQTPTPPPPAPPQVTDPNCVKRIQDVRAYEQAGYISHDQAQRLIERIVADCTT